MNKQYEEPVIEVITLEQEDVICTSEGGFETEPYGPGDFSWS